MLAPMQGPLLGAVVLNLGAAGVADPAERLERVYEWRVGRTAGWLRGLLLAVLVVLAPLLIDEATDGHAVDGTGRFFLAVAAISLAVVAGGMWIRLQRLEAEYAVAQALLAAIRVPSGPRPPARPRPAAPPTPPGAPPPPAALRDVTGSD